MQTLEERFWEKVNKTEGCWLWTACVSGSGYGQIRLEGKMRQASGVSWMLEHGSMPDLYVCHHCDNPLCVRPDHLFLGTQKDNAQDMIMKGRKASQSGRLNSQSMLDEADVVTIRWKLSIGMTRLQIASEYGIAVSTVTGINTRRQWSHVA